jgi:Cdc6-like AAA superfamily ATPase
MTAATTTGTARRDTAAQRPLTPWEYLAALLPLEDLTHAAHGNRLRPAVTVPAGGGEELLVRADPYDAAARTLYRTHRGNVLLTGRKGVGKTTFVRELARRAATGEIPFLSGRRFVWIDCRNVGPEDSRALGGNPKCEARNPKQIQNPNLKWMLRAMLKS